MQQKYIISGLKCHNCVAKVTQVFQKQLKIKQFNINLADGLLEVEDLNFDLAKANSALKKLGDYTIMAQNLIPNDKKVASYKPIYLILAYLLISNLVMQNPFLALDKFLTNFMASFFLVFSFFKMLDLKGFANGYSSYDIVAKKFYGYGYLYPFIELALGLAYVIHGNSLYLNLITLIIMSISSIGVILAKIYKRQFYCACVGTFLKVPLGSIAIIEDLLMVSMSLIMLIRIIY